MEDKIYKKLNEVIEEEIESLRDLDAGSKEKTDAVKDLTELYKLRIEEAKIEQAKVENSNEQESKREFAKSQTLDRVLNAGLQIGLAIGGWIVYDVWYRRGLKFEETGSITSPMTRNLLSRMLPRK